MCRAAAGGYADRVTVVVVGQAALDVVLRTDGLPDAGGSVPLREFRRRVGGKGANQAVAMAQLGVPVALVATLGRDEAGEAGLARLVADGVDVRAVTRRDRSAVLVDLVDAPGSRRLFEMVPESQLVTAADLDAARRALTGIEIDAVVLQLQQPADAVVAAARWGREIGGMVIADGAPVPESRTELLGMVRVLRMDAVEAEIVSGRPVRSEADAARAGEHLLGEGPELVVVAVPAIGDLLVWRGGRHLLSHGAEPVRDTTGGGDSFVAGLVAGLRRGEDAVAAGVRARDAAASTVQRYGGRPDLAR